MRFLTQSIKIESMKIDCNRQCDCCPAIICEERGNYTDTGVTNKINEEHIQNKLLWKKQQLLS